MDQSGTAIGPVQHNLKPARRKLQKNPRVLKSFFSKRWSHEPARRSLDGSEEPKNVVHSSAAAKQRPVSMAPDLSDAKWLDYLDRASVMSTEDTRAKPMLSEISELPPVIPELAHLAIDDNSNPPPLSPPSSPSSVARRQAKTPVFSIGQLEESARRRQARRAATHVSNLSNTSNTSDMSSAEAIAEQYRALLEPRGHEDAYTYTAPRLEATPSPVASVERRTTRSRPHALDQPRQSPSLQYAAQGSPTTLSSTSDDGTLVAFQEDAIYFKPVSFSAEPSPTALQHSFTEAMPTPASLSRENLSLDISLSLLSRQLSSALAGAPRAPAGRDAAALQVWVMIEAYEKLQEQLVRMNLAESELHGATGALRNWLTALYAVHKSLTSEEVASESEYED